MEKQQNQQDIDNDDGLFDECAKELDKKLVIDQSTGPALQGQGPTTSQPKPAGAFPTSVQDDLGLAGDIDFSKLPMNEADMAEAAKLFEECMKGMGDLNQENPNMENPFLAACNKMFKDYEQVQKDDVKKAGTAATGTTS